jgi:8-oxo-dGTP pyrophosphatase MutT (NUDIX family)
MAISPYIVDLRKKIGTDLLFVPSAAVAVWDHEGRLLVVQDASAGTWCIPGGAMDPLEEPVDTAVREVWEETGLLVNITGMVGVYGGREAQNVYSNGDRVCFTTTVFAGCLAGGDPKLDPEEIRDLTWITLEECRGLPAHPWFRGILPDLALPVGTSRYRAPSWHPPGEGSA